MRLSDLVNECRTCVDELFPWDLVTLLNNGTRPLLLDVREPYEFAAMHIKGSLNVPRGIIETACEYDYEETIPALVTARDSEIIVLCRSGNRSLLAARTMQILGYRYVKSLNTGLRGWNDYEQPLVDIQGNDIPIEDADDFFASRVSENQRQPKT